MAPPETARIPAQAPPDDLTGIKDSYEYGFHDPENYAFKAEKGLSAEVVEGISAHKKEPQWMHDFRLKALKHFEERPMPKWADGHMDQIDFQNIHYFVRASEKQGRTWDEVPDDIKNTFDKLGIPEAERKYLAGVGAQYESEVVYHQVREDLEKQGVIFKDMDTGLREHEDLVREYFATVIPPNDNKLAALNSAVWSGGSFVYVPPGVHVEMPLQAYFRINTENMGQFERTLIIADEGSFVHYIEGCHLAGSMVRVADGEKPIEEIQPGEEVLTHRGRFRPVKEAMQRPFKGPIFNIRFQGEGYRSLAVTPRHPFLAVRRHRAREHNKVFEPEWLEAHELRKGDYLAVPTGIDLEWEPEDSPGTLDQAVPVGRGSGPAVAERVQVALDEPMCRLIGLYLAEGTVTPNTSYLIFDSHRDEAELHDLVRSKMREAFGISGWEYDYSGQGRAGKSIRFSSVRAARFFEQSFGRTTAELRIPDWAFCLSESQRAALVRGVYDGEGSYDSKLDLYRINQTNQHVAQRLRELLLSLGIRASLSESGRPEPRRSIWQVAIGKVDHPRFEEIVLGQEPRPQRATHAYSVLADGYLWQPISSIERVHADCTVYNMSVEDDESYVCEGVISHNCTAPTYTTDSLHSAVVEIICKPDSRVRYTTIQNWSHNVYNLVTQRAIAQERATMEWIDGNLGCLAEGSLVSTREGSVPIESLSVGDEVLSYNEQRGELCFRPVTAKRYSERQPVRTVAAGGRQLRVTDNHPFYSYRHDPERAKKLGRYELTYRRADDLRHVIVPRGTINHGQSHRLAQPLRMPTAFSTSNQYQGQLTAVRERSKQQLILPEATSTELMWLFGYFVGDGDIERTMGKTQGVTRWARVSFSCPRGSRARSRLMATMEKLMPSRPSERADGVHVRWNSIELADFFEHNGFVSGVRKKFVPDWIARTPVAERRAFVAGYLDADGCVVAAKRVFQLKSTNRHLLTGVSRVLASLGVTGRLNCERAESKRVEICGEPAVAGASYTLNFPLDPGIADRCSPALCKQALDVPGPKLLHRRRIGRSNIELPECVEIAKVEVGEPQAILPTWDIEVEGTGNFVAEGFIVHNSKLTMKYPSIYLMGEKAHGEILSIAFAGDGQHQDAGGKVVHVAPKTTSTIISKSISKDGGRSSYRGLLEVAPGATESKSKVVCDALLLDENSRSDTYPTIRVGEDNVDVGHEATVSKIGEEQLFYLMSRGLTEEQASGMIVGGFIEPFTRELPMEYAVEMNRLIELQMEGSIG